MFMNAFSRFCLLTSIAYTATARNLITNPGFESGAAGWSFYINEALVSNAAEMLADIKFNMAHGGSRVCKVAVYGGQGVANSWYIQLWAPSRAFHHCHFD